MPEPLVSIIIPVYNAEKFLAATIQSAIDQTWQNKEIIIVDDGSSDASLAIAKTFQNNQVKVFSQKNKGAGAARNKGLREAKGEYIQFLDADDLLSPDKIAQQIQVLNGTQDYLGLCSTIYFKDADDYHSMKALKEWYDNGSNDPVDFLLKLYAGHEVIAGHGGMIQPNAWLTPKKLITEAGYWNEDLTIDDDGEYFCRVLLAGHGVKFSQSGINYYRKFDNQQSLSAQKTIRDYNSRLCSTNLKYSYLKPKANSYLLDKIFSRHYWEIGVNAFPQFKKISATAIQQAKHLNYSGPKYISGKIGTFLSNILGWRVIRLASYIIHRY